MPYVRLWQRRKAGVCFAALAETESRVRRLRPGLTRIRWNKNELQQQKQSNKRKATSELEVERRKRHGFEPEPGFSHDRFMQYIWHAAPEWGPWQLDDMPFEERAEKIEHHKRMPKIIETLVVGQEVWMVSGPYIKGECFIKGKVVKFSPYATVEVLELPMGDRKGGELRRFCLDGTSDGNRHHYHPEFGPWRLDDMPFAERTALL